MCKFIGKITYHTAPSHKTENRYSPPPLYHQCGNDRPLQPLVTHWFQQGAGAH